MLDVLQWLLFIGVIAYGLYKAYQVKPVKTKENTYTWGRQINHVKELWNKND